MLFDHHPLELIVTINSLFRKDFILERLLESDIFTLVARLGFRLRLYVLTFLVYLSSSFYLQLDNILLFRDIVIGDLSELHRLNLS